MQSFNTLIRSKGSRLSMEKWFNILRHSFIFWHCFLWLGQIIVVNLLKLAFYCFLFNMLFINYKSISWSKWIVQSTLSFEPTFICDQQFKLLIFWHVRFHSTISLYEIILSGFWIVFCHWLSQLFNECLLVFRNWFHWIKATIVIVDICITTCTVSVSSYIFVTIYWV